jgi:hypothetical protein
MIESGFWQFRGVEVRSRSGMQHLDSSTAGVDRTAYMEGVERQRGEDRMRQLWEP